MNTSALLPSSYHSMQSESVTQSDSHGTCEQKTILTETRRVTETTMRMEHKSPHPDIDFKEFICPTPSPIPVIPVDTNEIKTSETKTFVETISVPKSQHFHDELDHLAQTHTHENIKYKTFDAKPENIQNHQPIHSNYEIYSAVNGEHKAVDESNLLTPGPAPEIGYMPRPSDSNLCVNMSDNFKTSENAKINEYFEMSDVSQHFPSKKIVEEKKRTFSESMTNDIDAIPVLHKQVQSVGGHEPSGMFVYGFQPPSPQIDHGDKKSSVRDTIQTIANKIKEYEHDTDYELKAPSLVRFVDPLIKPYESGVQKSQNLQCNLEPGAPPEICFAARLPTERKSSMVESIEKKLEDDLKKGPTKVLPLSVRMMPPSPNTVSSETFESTKKQFFKKTEHFESGPPRHVHYEHTKSTENTHYPMEIKQKPTSTPYKDCEKVRSISFSVN